MYIGKFEYNDNIMKVNKAVILAAGKGTRFLPYSKAHPKEMLAVIDRPSLQLIVEEVVASGITDILIVISPEKQDIKRYFEQDTALEQELNARGKIKEAKAVAEINNLANIQFVYQIEPKGTGDAIMLAREWTQGEPFVVLNGDDVMFGDKPVTRQLVEAYERVGYSVVGVQSVNRQAIGAYASCKVVQMDGRLYHLQDIVEKPKTESEIFSLLAPLGRYLFTSAIFDEIAKAPWRNGEVYVTDAIRSLAKTSSVYAFDFEGERYDFGDKFGYIKGFTVYALNSVEYGEQYKQFLQNLLKKK